MENVKICSSLLKEKFNLEKIGNFSVKSPIHKEFRNCEYLGEDENDKSNFGSLTFGLDFIIEKNNTRLYSKSGILYGFLKNKPNDLIILSCGVTDGKSFKKVGYFRPDKSYGKYPGSNLDFKWMVEDFTYLIGEQFEEKRLEHHGTFNKNRSVTNHVSDDDLPF